jgi:hypothetical protein
MRFWFTVKINKTVVLERDGEDADEARSKINFASINLADFDWGPADFQIIETEPAD